MKTTWTFANGIHNFLPCRDNTTCLNKPKKLEPPHRHNTRPNNDLVDGVNVRAAFEQQPDHVAMSVLSSNHESGWRATLQAKEQKKAQIHNTCIAVRTVFQMVSNNLRHATSKTNQTCDFSNRVQFVLLIDIRFASQQPLHHSCLVVLACRHKASHSILCT